MKKILGYFNFTLVFLALAGFAAAQSTEFTYQGDLKVGGVTATGNYDFEFVLYDGTVGGNPFGPILTRGNVPVANGVFGVKLDFGNPFNGGARFIEIRVRQTGGGAYSISATPTDRQRSICYQEFFCGKRSSAWRRVFCKLRCNR